MRRIIVRYRDVVRTNPGWTEDDYIKAIEDEEKRCKGKDWSELDPDNEVNE